LIVQRHIHGLVRGIENLLAVDENIVRFCEENAKLSEGVETYKSFVRNVLNL
jgi:hypothetical protein